MRLTDEQLRAVLARAEEIQRDSPAIEAWNAEVQLIYESAEELGLSRQAIERALAERRDLFTEPPRMGQLVWARSSNGKFYVAEVLSPTPRGAIVRFLSGGETEVGAEAMRPCAFLPGDRMTCDWPWWGEWTCKVTAYDAPSRTVLLNDGWGEEEIFPISEVWLPPDKKRGDNRRLMLWKVAGIGAAVGTVVGMLATLGLLR